MSYPARTYKHALCGQSYARMSTLLLGTRTSFHFNSRFVHLRTFCPVWQVVERLPVQLKKKKATEESGTGREQGSSTSFHAIELYMTIASDYSNYVPKSLVQRAQFQQLFCSDVADCLGIHENSVEFISCHPVETAPGSGEGMTEIVFLILAADGRYVDEMFPNQYLGPRVLAAELGALVADPDSSLHQSLSLRAAVSLKFKIGGKLGASRKPVGASDAFDSGDDSSTGLRAQIVENVGSSLVHAQHERVDLGPV
jgi:hypothetical protein